MIRPGHLHMQILLIETAYSMIIASASLAIYLRTKELYELSDHRGIQYFGYTFLFFGASFFLRTLVPIFARIFEIHFHNFRHELNFLLVFTGTMAVFCLLYSVLWKRFERISVNPFYILIATSVFIAGTTLIGRVRLFILLFQAALFTAAIAISYIDYIKSKRGTHSKLFLLYTLLFFSWIANVFANFTTRLSLPTGLALYIISIALFVSIFYRVLKITRMVH